MDARRRAAQNGAAKKDSANTVTDASGASSTPGTADAGTAAAAASAIVQAQTFAAKGAGRTSVQSVDFSRLRTLGPVELAQIADIQARLASKVAEMLAQLSDEFQPQYKELREQVLKRVRAKIRQASGLAPDAEVPWDAERQNFYEVQCYHELGRLLTRQREEKERVTTATLAMAMATPTDGSNTDPLSGNNGGSSRASSTRGPIGGVSGGQPADAMNREGEADSATSKQDLAGNKPSEP